MQCKGTLLSFVLVLYFPFCILSQKAVTIRGTIGSLDSGEPMVGVFVQDTMSRRYAISDGHGVFSLSLPNEKACLFFQYTGFENQFLCDSFEEGESLSVLLHRAGELPQVEVTASAISRTMTSDVASIPMNTVRLLPQLGGEADVLKTIALMPGISLGVEGTTGLHIRGGSPGQNLVLLDEAPVYNLSHFGAFLSVFNAGAVKQFQVHKGSWPAQYGGRLSGLVDIRTREGNRRYWEGKATISPLLASILVEGPVSDKTSILFSGRSSWLGGLLKLMSNEEATPKYLMYDANAKITHFFNDRNQLHLSYYSSLDDSQVKEVITGGTLGSRERLSSDSRAGVKWGNQTATIRQSSLLGKSIVFQNVIYYTRYRFNSYESDRNYFADGEETFFATSSTSSNRDFGVRSLLSYQKNSWKLKVGGELVKQQYSPNSGFATDNDSTLFVSTAKALQQNYFVDGEYQPNRAWTLRLGLRYTHHNSGDTVYSFLEPRLRTNVQLGRQWGISFNAHYGQQYIHLLFGGNTGLLNEIWLGSTARVPPQRGSLLAMGIYWSSKKGAYTVELETFYRRMSGLVEFQSIDQSSEVTGPTEWEDLVETGGQGRVKGLELLVRKRSGKLTGWLSYTWSNSSRRFNTINRGDWFPFRFDRRHDISLVLLYPLGKKWTCSATWIYQTGSYLTLPTAKIPNTYILEDGIFYSGNININERRNNVRLPAYHRLDISVTYAWKGRKRKRDYRLGFDIYNAYNRINPYFIRTESAAVFSNTGEYLGQTEPKTTVVGLFPLIPSVSFSCDFNQRSLNLRSND